MVYSPPPINTQVGPNAPWPLGATPQTSPSRQSPSGYEPSPPVISVPLSHAKNPGSSSPSNRHPLNRPLSPDLPTRDALYLFSNFSSYMQSPNEGAEGVGSNEDFGDTLRLLDYARSLANQPYANVHVLHLKYRFEGEQQPFRSPYTTGDRAWPLNHRDSAGRLSNPVPQPFSTLHDPVVKVAYTEKGVFEPLPAQAVFSHIAKVCQPPPRIIVFSYVSSKATENHLASISQWALTSSPPSYIFSPLETRIRERRPLHRALHHAIPMSMYAWPASRSNSQYSKNTSPTSQTSEGVVIVVKPDVGKDGGVLNVPGGVNGDEQPAQMDSIRPSQVEKEYPPDPVASLTVVVDNRNGKIAALDQLDETSGDWIPLWALAPGVGILQGSTSASVGVKLIDFSAINLVSTEDQVGTVSGGRRASSTASRSIRASDAGIRTSPIDLKGLGQPLPPVEAPSRPATPAKALNANGPSRIGAKMISNAKAKGIPLPHMQDERPTHLTPPDRMPPRLSATPPDHPPRLNGTPPQNHRHLSPEQVIPNVEAAMSTASWPSPVSKVPGWRKGRKEQMEDTLEELGLVGELLDLTGKMEGLGLQVDEGVNGIVGMRGVEEEDDELGLLRFLVVPGGQ